MSIKFGKVIKTLSVGVVILVAVTLSALRFWLPHFSSYRGEVETWLSLRLGHPVKIGAMSAEMRGLGAAALRFTDVMFLDQTMRVDGAAGVDRATRVDEATRVEQPQHLDQAKRLPLFSFHEVEVEVDLWRSLLALRPQFGAYPPMFTRMLAERLTARSKISVQEGASGVAPQRRRTGNTSKSIGQEPHLAPLPMQFDARLIERHRPRIITLILGDVAQVHGRLPYPQVSEVFDLLVGRILRHAVLPIPYSPFPIPYVGHLRAGMTWLP